MLPTWIRIGFLNLMQPVISVSIRGFVRSDYFLPALFLFLLFVASTSLWKGPYDEVGDQALIGLQTVRAGQFAEGVGPYSRVGFHHPGPITFYIYAAAEVILPFIEAPGQRYRFAQFLLNAGLFLWSFALLRRLFPGRYALIALAFFLVSVAPLGPDMWFSVWGPHSLLVPYLLFFVSYLGVCRGRLQDFLPGTVAAVLIVHNHISGITLLLPLALLAFYRLARQKVRPDRAGLRYIAFAAAFLLVTSLPVLIDEFAGTGNLSAIYRYFTGDGSASRRVDKVLVYLTGYYLDPVRPVIQMHPVLWFGLLSGMPLLVWHRLDAVWRSLHVNLMIVFLLSLLAALRVSGDLVPHLFWHLHPFVGFHLLLALVALKSLTGTIHIAPRWLVLQASLLITALVVTYYRPAPLPAGPTAIEKAMEQVRQYPGPYRLRFPLGSADHNRWVEAAGLALKIVREGGSYCVDQEWAFMFPHGSTCPEGFAGTTLRLTSSDSGQLLIRHESEK